MTQIKSDNGNRYCIDNGAMIAWAGLLLARKKQFTPVSETTVTQR
jgi:tRNA A37 threonylcarbamoyltransferase TsaD